jgi:hypothetical protein
MWPCFVVWEYSIQMAEKALFFLLFQSPEERSGTINESWRTRSRYFENQRSNSE